MSKPLAWIGVFDGEPDPEFLWWDEAKARRWIKTRPGVELAPLYQQPTLTDAEREAIMLAATWSEHGILPSTVAAGDRLAATLRALLERMTQTGEK